MTKKTAAAMKQQFIEFALEAGVLKFGEFTLKSGRKSPYFFNAGLFNQGEHLVQLGYYYAATLAESKLKYDGLFGPAYKGIPLVCATVMQLAASFKQNIPFTFNRKEAKDHGEGGQLVGAALEGNIVIVDDVITAGTAFREAAAFIEQARATLSGVVVALDRQEKGQGDDSAIHEIEQKHGIEVLSVITLADLISYIKTSKDAIDHLPAIQAYQEKYGVS